MPVPRLIGAGSTVTERHAYDAAGRRVKRAHAGGTTVYAAGGLWEETLGGSRRAIYTLQGRAVAQRDGATNQVLYLHGDHLGSVAVVTDQAGAVVSRQQYDPWGAPRGGEGIGEDRTTLDFTGQRRDGTGLLYYGARYYDPVTARFLSADSIAPDKADPQTRNRYAYVRNNPLKYVDPTGHCEETDVLDADPNSENNRCFALSAQLGGYGVEVENLWTHWMADQLATVLAGVERLAGAAGWSPSDFRQALGGVRLAREMGRNPDYAAFQQGNRVVLTDTVFDSVVGAQRYLVHELAHAWDWASGEQLSEQMRRETDSSYCPQGADSCRPGQYLPGQASHLPSDRAAADHFEDFADSVDATVFQRPQDDPRFQNYLADDSTRNNYVNRLFAFYRQNCGPEGCVTPRQAR